MLSLVYQMPGTWSIKGINGRLNRTNKRRRFGIKLAHIVRMQKGTLFFLDAHSVVC